MSTHVSIRVVNDQCYVTPWVPPFECIIPYIFTVRLSILFCSYIFPTACMFTLMFIFCDFSKVPVKTTASLYFSFELSYVYIWISQKNYLKSIPTYFFN